MWSFRSPTHFTPTQNRTVHIPPIEPIPPLLSSGKAFSFPKPTKPPLKPYFTLSLSAAVIETPPSIETTLLDGLPKPDPLDTIFAIPRSDSGKNVSAKERKAGRVPSIVFEQEDGQHGGNKRLISLKKNRIRNLVNEIGRPFFLSRLFELDVRPQFESDEVIEKVRVLPRSVHLHAGTDEPLNVTFIRAPSHALLKVDIPLVFRGEDISPGLRKG
ncbi:hypothetical protein OIU74_013041 [Salix koriyanagi]|uniref:Large ribosomal subunit protein bL25 L25 domain-containing protein n=1 Tax=Salix koriyanagi TaxID=2511006 RepID=A0A9Q0T5V3_9ROSI|nr:hypothetical protein OIU74_013041 [Salix koriyanagi]